MRVARLVLNGEIDKSWLADTLSGESDIYCTDGSFNVLSELGIIVERVIGDMDSIDKTLRHAPIELLENQNLTDFEKAIVYLSDRYNSLRIYGASGGNVDHFLGNLSVAKKYSKEIDLVFYEPSQYYFFIRNPTTIEGVKDRIISIIPFPELKSVFSHGLKYPLDNHDLELGSTISVRNLAIYDKVTIRYNSGCGIIVVEK